MPYRPPSCLRVVVPAHQAAADLGTCLAALARAGFGPGAVVVVDDGSTDGTGRVARAAGAEVRRTARVGAAQARNVGARGFDGDLLIFVDSDVVVAPSARTVIEAAFAADPDLTALFGSYDARPAAPGRVSRFRNMLHRHVHQVSAGPVQSFWTGLGAVRRDAFVAVGGFDPSRRMMEDVDLGLRLAAAGGRIRLAPDLQGTHLKAWTLGRMVRTDLLDRAIPWSRMILSRGGDLPRAFNVGWRGRVSVVAAAMVLAGLALLPAMPLGGAATAAAGVVCLGAANAPFLRRLRREGHGDLLAVAVPLLTVHYLCAGVGFAVAWASERVVGPVRRIIRRRD